MMQVNVMIRHRLYPHILRKHHLRHITNKVKLHTSGWKQINKDEFKEVEIPVPWGQISGKWWGRQDVQPMLALHGVQDNAATFDRLAPLLQVDALLALDIPGHGRSSHIPKGFLYHFMDAICVTRFVIKDHFRWKEPVSLLGHSFGSAISYVYTALYPDQVAKYISIDCARHQMATLPDTVVGTLRTTLDKTLDYEEKSTPPEYTYDQLVELLHKGRKYRLSRESCEVLLTRGMTKLDNGKVHLSRDSRVKLNACGRLTLENLVELAHKIKCDVLSIQAENGTVKNDIKGEAYREGVNIMVKRSPKSKHLILAGNHHLHLDDPEPVAIEINKFLTN